MVARRAAGRAGGALGDIQAQVLHTVPLQKINYDLAETIAWPKLVALVAREYGSLQAAQRRRTTILSGNYGEAGAIDATVPEPACPGLQRRQQLLAWGPPTAPTPRPSR